MLPISLDAVLLANDNSVLEKGTLIIPESGSTVDFKNDFVPLVNLGRPVKVGISTYGEPYLTLTGNAYLSSKNLLRIDSVADDILDDIRSFFISNTNFQTTIESYRNRLLQIFNKNNDLVSINAYYITESTIKFYTLKDLSVGKKFLLNIEHPVSLKNVILSIDDKEPIGSRAIRYLCSIEKISITCQDALTNYVRSLELRDSPQLTETN